MKPHRGSWPEIVKLRKGARFKWQRDVSTDIPERVFKSLGVSGFPALRAIKLVLPFAMKPIGGRGVSVVTNVEIVAVIVPSPPSISRRSRSSFASSRAAWAIAFSALVSTNMNPSGSGQCGRFLFLALSGFRRTPIFIIQRVRAVFPQLH